MGAGLSGDIKSSDIHSPARSVVFLGGGCACNTIKGWLYMYCKTERVPQEGCFTVLMDILW